MTVFWVVVAVLFVLWVVISNKTSRPDGTYLRDVHPYRRIMQFLMPTRNESLVYFDDYVKADELLRFLGDVRKRYHVDITHTIVAAAGIGLAKVPSMNRFVVGRRLYQRKGRWIAFSMKRKKKDEKAKIATVKIDVPDGQSFRELVARVEDKIGVERSDAVTYTDKELDFFIKMPRFVMNVSVRLLKWLDYHNLLPLSFTGPDPFYSSIFVANLGSIGMRPAFHHLYEWGTCPLFIMVGKIEDRPVVVDGAVTVQKTLHIRYTYDERIDDGLTANGGIRALREALEDPYTAFGCVAEDGSDERPLIEG